MTLIRLDGVSKALLNDGTGSANLLGCFGGEDSLLWVWVILWEEKVRHSLALRLRFIDELQERHVATCKMSEPHSSLRLPDKEEKWNYMHHKISTAHS